MRDGQPSAGRSGRIDVHQHLLPPEYRKWLRSRGLPAPGERDPDWEVDHAIELMDRHGIAAAILSVSTPGVTPGDAAEAAAMARSLNEFSAAVVHDHPGRFGFFATIPLPDVARATEEAAYAFDHLAADGVTLLANSGGVYLGSPELEPLMAELDLRAAVVIVHPGPLPGPSLSGIPSFAADFLLDTTRAAMNLVRNQMTRRYPRIRFILAHAGGFVPYAAHRIALAMVAETSLPLRHLLDDFGGFYFDVALSGSPAALPSLFAFAKPGHVLFGTDWPFAPDAAVSYFTGQFDAWHGAGEQDLRAANRDNALHLFPRFA